MNSKFFNNQDGNSLFSKLQGIFGNKNNSNLNQFLAVSGFFYSSGYFKLRKELENVDKIKILVGISVDKIFKTLNPNVEHTKTNCCEGAQKEYRKEYVKDINKAKYSKEIEAGIRQMAEDLKSGKLEMRIHPTKNLHAKFYLCLPEEYSKDTNGWVIMGSSNISESGLGISWPEQYELNVAMTDYDDVNYCKEQFEQLWEEGIEIPQCEGTYLDEFATPYEIYMKVLIEMLGDQVEDDFTLELPEGVMDLKYQKDAVIQGYQIMKRHDGVFLADVVGLGKTLIATMIAKRFIEENGKDTNILVVYPPALEDNWHDTFKLFDIKKNTQFVTNGSLDKVIKQSDNFRPKEDFDLVIVDESHGYRNQTSDKYIALQQIIKSGRIRKGNVPGSNKKVMLLSATPINNDPSDFYNQLLLFQDNRSNIPGVPNLYNFFAPLIKKYKVLMAERKEIAKIKDNNRRRIEMKRITDAVDKEVYKKIRENVIDKITVRRTRSNIVNNPDYMKDLDRQHIKFPEILPPKELVYHMDTLEREIFLLSLNAITGENGTPALKYARYNIINGLKDDCRPSEYNSAKISGQNLADIYKTHMVKRLESSFDAFKKSLESFKKCTESMIKMFEADRIVVIPDMNISELLNQKKEIDLIIEDALSAAKKKGSEAHEFKKDDFQPWYIENLKFDRDLLKNLIELWEKVTEDPKYKVFVDKINTELFKPDVNPTGKLVVFSESVDTLDYLEAKLKKDLHRDDILKVSAENRKNLDKTIKANFDANYSGIKENKYNIILTSDVLAEGINLHRSNVIVNYDSPWNATKLMQRIGRVNRIGSTAPAIYNYMFYPSAQGEDVIGLYSNALIKLQGFHSAFGEDIQIFTKEEIVKYFEMYNSHPKDFLDERIKLIREIGNLRRDNPELYEKIKNMPVKSRTLRKDSSRAEKTVVFVQNGDNKEFWLCEEDKKGLVKADPIDFSEAVRIFKADMDEKSVVGEMPDYHYSHVNAALDKSVNETSTGQDNQTVAGNVNKSVQEAVNILRGFMRTYGAHNTLIVELSKKLEESLEKGMFANLPAEVRKLKKITDVQMLETKLQDLCEDYVMEIIIPESKNFDNSEPVVVVSETFVR